MKRLILFPVILMPVMPALAQDEGGSDAVIELPALSEDASGDAEIGDHHDGYYYPAPQSVETYRSRVVTLPDSDKLRRLGFVIGMARQSAAANYAPAYAIFAKGDHAQKLIIVGLRDGELNTIYRARAVLATLTLVARSTPFFQKQTQAEEATFLDLLKLLGFTQLTISDGKEFAHQISIE